MDRRNFAHIMKTLALEDTFVEVSGALKAEIDGRNPREKAAIATEPAEETNRRRGEPVVEAQKEEEWSVGVIVMGVAAVGALIFFIVR